METHVSQLTVEELRSVIADAVKEAFEDNLEDFLAVNSPNYLEAIREGREDIKAGRLTRLEDMRGV